MLERLIIKNFQKHAKLVIELDPHITSIVGPSDAGKSAVIRALGWLATNRPTGNDFVRRDADNEMARVVLDIDGSRIKRIRSRSENTYTLDGKTFTAFGAEVPAPIADLLNIGPDNFQWQMDPPFWFTDGAPAVSRKLNNIIDLGIIDDVLAKLGAQHRKAKTVLEVTKERLATARAENKALKWVLQADVQLQELEATDKKLRAAREGAGELRAVVQQCKQLAIAQDSFTGSSVSLAMVVAKGFTAASRAKRRRTLAGLVAQAKVAKQAASQQPPDIGPLSAAFKAYRQLAKQRAALADLFESVEGHRNLAEMMRTDLVDLETKIEQKTKGICPLCHQPLKKP